MNLLLIDNFDSFTYNLVQYIREIEGVNVTVVRNNAVDLDTVASYDGLVLSPGPGIPSEAGMMPAVIKAFAGTIPMLGICLGHQAIGEAFGAQLKNLEQVHHGLATEMIVTTPEHPLFKDLPTQILVGRYHSWAVEPEGLPECLEVLAVDQQGEIMALRHREFDLTGLQFHPESILTPSGKKILGNYFNQYLTHRKPLTIQKNYAQ